MTVGNFPRRLSSARWVMCRLYGRTLSAGVQEAVAEILALQDLLYDVVSIDPGRIHSHELVLHRVLFHRMPE